MQPTTPLKRKTSPNDAEARNNYKKNTTLDIQITPSPKKKPSKTLPLVNESVFSHFKTISDITPVNLMRVPSPQILSRKIANNMFHLIYVQNGMNNDEYFSHPLTKAICSKHPSSSDMSIRETTKIIAIAPRRISKADNSPQYKRPDKNNESYKALYYLAYYQPPETSQRNCLAAIANVSLFIDDCLH